MPALWCADKKVGLWGGEEGFRVVRDLSRLRDGEAARREAREWVESAEGFVSWW